MAWHMMLKAVVARMSRGTKLHYPTAKKCKALPYASSNWTNWISKTCALCRLYPSSSITCPAEHAKCRDVIPLVFLVRRSTPDSTNASATDHVSTPGVLSPVDTPSSVRHTPSKGVDVLRWCLTELSVVDGVGAADAADAGCGLNNAVDTKLLLVVVVVVLAVLALQNLPREDAANPSAKCIGGRAPGVQISTSTSPTPHDDDVDVSGKAAELLGCWCRGGTILLSLVLPSMALFVLLLFAVGTMETEK